MKRYIAITICCIFAGYLLLVLSMLIPQELIKKNVVASAEELYTYGDYPTIYLDNSFVENFCDADYLAVAYNQRTDNIFYNALDAFNYCYDEESGAARGVNALFQTFYGNPTRIYEHSHAWHGYRIFLKTLLIFYSVSEIRWIFVSLCFAAIVLICLMMYKISGRMVTVIPFLFAYLFFSLQLETISFSVSINLLLMLVPCIFILYGCMTGKEESYYVLCLYLTGMCHGYFALFDLPSLSIGFPIITLFAFNKKTYNKTELAIKMMFFWGLGYLVEAGTKLVINELFMNKGGSSYVVKWYTGSIHKTGIIDRAVRVNELFFKALNYNKVATTILCIGVIVLIFIMLLKKKYRNISLKDIIAFALVGMIPVFYTFIMPIHSNISWSVFMCSISVYSIAQYLWSVIISDSR